MEDKLGVIFHWGVYSVSAYDDPESASKRKIQNGSEWYYKRLLETGKFRPISGWQSTQIYHKEKYKDLQYKDFAPMFRAEKWNVNDWMELCKKVGATYVILTAKHHDGFCLWPTKTRDQSFPPTDIIKIFSEAAKKYNLKFGIYYSWSEFNVGCTRKYLNEIVKPQIEELMKYSPRIWWFDGDWSCKTKYSQNFMDKICDQIHETLPNTIINDRTGHQEERKFLNYLGKFDYRVYEDRALPNLKPKVPWEHINTIGLSWGRNQAQKENNYKTGKQLFELYQKVQSLGGKFLLNLGPNSDGSLDPIEVQKLIEFGNLFKV